MRIITGIYKGRHFDIPRTFKARPTTDFAKENIFNVLTGYIDFEGATALDLFSGTGSISLELLSRGCKQVVSVELDRDHHRFIQECVRKLAASNSNIIPLRADVPPPRRCLPLPEVLQTAVRLHLCRPPIRPEGTAPDSRPHLREAVANRRGHLCLRTWQRLRFLQPSSFSGASQLWQRKLLAV